MNVVVTAPKQQAASWLLRRPAPGRVAGLVSRAELAVAARQLLRGMRDGTMSEAAYDTALVSALRSQRDPAQLAFPASLGWLRQFQHGDGSWGGRIPTAHDRLVSTLAALVRLADLHEDWAPPAVRDGIAWVWRHAGDWLDDPHETIAFELLVPRLLDEAQRLGLPLPFDAFAPVMALRDDKLHRMPPEGLYAQPTTAVHSLEFLGRELDWSQVRRLQGANGAYGNSPSATAYVVGGGRDAEGEAYLRRVVSVSLNGGACTVYPFEIFEKNWVLYNLWPTTLRPAGLRPHLEYLHGSLRPAGVGLSREGLVPDADDTVVALLVLWRHGYEIDPAAVLAFEGEGCFRSFPFERTTSTTVNAHVLEALRDWQAGGVGKYASQIAKIVAYLRDERRDGAYWFDKWHISPYYATTQVVLGAGGLAAELVGGTSRWLLETQRPDGSWGWYTGTVEETAYALQALLTLSPEAEGPIGAALARGAAYLSARFNDTDYRELWVGKGLYTPYAIVRSAVIGALQLYRDARGR
jgi:halimadienyl-diphosphate synthase